jgi:Rap1a immunity proteins
MKARLLGVAALVGTIVTSSPIQAEHEVASYMTGEQLTQHCRAFLETRRTTRSSPQIYYDAALCYGFVTGVHDAVSFEELFKLSPPELSPPLQPACLPFGVNANSLIEIVATFLDQNPVLRTQGAYVLVRRAFIASYPCKK